MTMGRYVKKPVEIEAVQFTAEVALRALVDKERGPFGLRVYGRFHGERREIYSAYVPVGAIGRAEIGDWIIRNEGGQFSLCQQNIFEATYDLVELQAVA